MLCFPILYVNGSDELFAGQEWYDLIETVEVNRELPHAYFIPYQNEKLALENEKSVFTKDIYKSDYLQSLNGEWDFFFSKSPYEQLSWNDIENWDTTLWDKINIPSNVQLQYDENGFKYDTPIYTNMLYPWVNYENIELSEYPKAPLINNSVTHYKKEFIIEKNWNNRQVFVNFDGIGSAFYLFINGKKVGYSEDTYTTHQFNITSYLNKDDDGNISNQTNTIAIQLYRFSTGSYLENQDMIRLNGIFRDVFLVSKNDVEIRDLFIKTSTDTNTTLTLEASVRNLSNELGGKYKLTADLFNQNDIKIWSTPLTINFDINKPIKDISLLSKDKGVTNSNKKEIVNPKLWSDENPYLYRLLVNLYDSNNNIIETTVLRFGVRDIDIKTLDSGKQQITINDMPLLIKGVNRHEIDSKNGSVFSKEDIINDLIIMKQNNINSLRTSHYPNNVYTYQVADELGIYVMDESNIESHYGAIVDDLPSGYPAWKYSVLDRVKNMVERDKNYTSIIMWSLGNEATYKEYELNDSYNILSASNWILEKDPSRLRAYERDNRNIGDREGSVVDVFSSQYYSTTKVLEHLNSDNNLPYFQSEYAHSMGNALGNLKEYWDIFRSYDNAQGGYIWDFKDQAILIPTSFNQTNLSNINTNINDKFYAYGGDFGERSSDLEFSGNGLLFADGSLSPKMHEVKKVYQNINFKAIDIDEGVFNIDNEFSFTNLKNYSLIYKIINDGKLIKEESINTSLKPKSNKNIKIKLDKSTFEKGLYSSIIFEVKLKSNTNYNLNKNDVIAYEQFELYKGTQNEFKSDSLFDEVIDNDKDILISGKSKYGVYTINFDKTKGLIKEYILNNKVIFNNGPRLNYTRSPISNDSQYSFNENLNSKYAIELEDTQQAFIINKTTVTNNTNNIVIDIEGNLIDKKNIIKITYKIYADGNISILNEYTPSSSLSGVIPKVGMELSLDNKFNNVQYYGNGPFENYLDRNTASIKNIYHDKVENMFTSMYLKPQDNGYRTLVDYIKLSNNDNEGILITGNDFQVSALPYNHKELNSVNHPYELNNSNYIYLNINGNTRGLGNAICGDLPLPEYTINLNKTITYKYMIVPFNKELSNDDLIEYSLLN